MKPKASLAILVFVVFLITVASLAMIKITSHDAVTEPNLRYYFKLDDMEGDNPRNYAIEGKTISGDPIGLHWGSRADSNYDFKGLVFSGKGDRFRVASIDDLNLTEGTVSLVFYADNLTQDTHYLFGYSSSKDTYNDRIQLYVNDGCLNVGLGDTHYLGKAYRIMERRFYHIVLTWGGGHYDMYVNSREYLNGTYTGLEYSRRDFDIGNNGADKDMEGWSGLISEVRIYDRALYDKEIEKLHYDLMIDNR